MPYDPSQSTIIPFTIPVGVSPPGTHMLTVVLASGGSTTPKVGVYTYNDNDSVSIIATPNADFSFNSWIANGVNMGSVNPLVFNITSDTTISPVFVAIFPPPKPEDNNLLLIAAGTIGVAVIGAGAYYATKKKSKGTKK